MGRLCGLFDYTRQAYYDRLKYKEIKLFSSEIILDMVREIRTDMPRIGAKKLYIKLTSALKMMGVDIGRDAFAELLSDNNLLVRRKRSKHRTTFSNHRFFKYPNLIRNFTPTAPN